MSYQYITNSGVIVPDTDALQSEVVQEWRDALGADIAVTPDTPQGVMITAEVLAREGVANNNAQLANQINPNLAGGVFLDAICALMGIERRRAKASSVQATLYGAANTIVPAGSRAQATTGSIWTLRTLVQLDAAGQALGTFDCLEVGPTQCLPGSLNQVVDMVLGWDAVNNTQPGTLGNFEESDAELANRRTVTLGRQGISTREAQISGLNDVDGVSSVAFRENTTAAIQVIDGISMRAHSVWACVDGGEDQAIAESLLKNKTDGAAFNGAESVSVTDPWSGQVYTVLFDRPRYIPVYVTVTVSRGREQADPVTAIPESIVKWSLGAIPQDSGLPIGQDVSAYEVAGAINYYNPGFIVRNVALSAPSLPGEGPTTIDIATDERAIIEPQFITVVVL